MDLSFQGKKRCSKAMIRRGKRDDWVAPEIPWEIEIEILIRLPVKSLMRFKCVSKLWFDLILSQYFTNRYHLPVACTPRLHMSLVYHVPCDALEVCHNPYESVLLSLSLSSSSSSDNAKSFYSDLIMPGMGGNDLVVLRGLILYVVCRKACIYNPVTRQSITLPAVKSKTFNQDEVRKHVFYDFGHDPVLDQYKVVCTVALCSKIFVKITSEHWVLVLGSGCSWKTIEFDQPHMPTRAGLCIDGVLYYLASTCNSRSVLVRFDVGSEECITFQVPHSLASIYSRTSFIEYGGKPAVFDNTHLVPAGLVVIWVLEDGGRWSTKSLFFQSCQMHLVDNNMPLYARGTTHNGEVILGPARLVSPYHILYYDVQKNDLRKVGIQGIPDHWFVRKPDAFNFYLSIMDKSESIMHLES
ncbi:unnamed protein product [Microthlaspi erraticum]|uniref:F-box domain-containing protein n=1 Tax=Microthlaspi erraticum TaxID=1685480 RepID=A0A6D2JQG1_9BRAS|nr:unnamed protein product [Microthlaspi erraticum]